MKLFLSYYLILIENIRHNVEKYKEVYVCREYLWGRGAAHTKRRERPLLAKEGTVPGI